MRSRLTIQSSVSTLHGIGPTTAQRLKRLGIETVEHLLWHIPFRYEDYRKIIRIADVQIGQTATVEGTIERITNRRSFRRRMTVTEALVQDDSGTLKVVWFNQPFLTKNIRPNDQMMLSGRVSNQHGNLQLVSPAYEKRSIHQALHTGRLVPIYTTTSGLTERQLRYFCSQAIPIARHIPDPMPADIIKREKLLPIGKTLATIHFPNNEYDRDRALERLKFDELFLFQLSRALGERRAALAHAHAIPFADAATKSFIASLPFALTNSQRRAAWDILQDLNTKTPMNRLLEGDVGSGKTIVAAIAALNTLTAGRSVALLAPTAILARQHFLTFRVWFRTYDWPIILRTSAFREIALHGENAKRFQSTQATQRLTIGTHAMLEEKVDCGDLGLIVVDEQHRFGVGQRQTLRARSADRQPHFLSLTATPIPRTLALTLAGDLRLSVLRSLPKGRKPIVTKLLGPHERDRAYRTAEYALAAGRQAFMIAPRIEPSDAFGVASATMLFEEMQARFRNRRIGVLHGKLPPREKDATLLAFAHHDLDVLVATPVVEVGIDIPNATVMIIEGAERFGLAQLHQLRGRIGRGEHASTCFLCAQTETPLARKRLAAVAETTDGFRLAELDLKLRGPGDLAGTTQSGFLDFRYATLGDYALMARARNAAILLLDSDPTLATVPEVKKIVRTFAKHRE